MQKQTQYSGVFSGSIQTNYEFTVINGSAECNLKSVYLDHEVDWTRHVESVSFILPSTV